MFGGGSGQRRFKNKCYKRWLEACPEIASKSHGTVHVHYQFYWPCNRERDGQNYLKAPMDYLVSKDVLEDDNWKVVSSESWAHSGVKKEFPMVEVYFFDSIV